jgi:hypothetical protein
MERGSLTLVPQRFQPNQKELKGILTSFPLLKDLERNPIERVCSHCVNTRTSSPTRIVPVCNNMTKNIIIHQHALFPEDQGKLGPDIGYNSPVTSCSHKGQKHKPKATF